MMKKVDAIQNGCMRQFSIEEIKCEAYKYIMCRIGIGVPPPDCNDVDPTSPEYFMYYVFGSVEKPMFVNSKNIEYEDWFNLHDFPTENKTYKRLAEYGIDDLNIHMIVYRLGSHSYYAVDVDKLIYINKKDA